MQGCQIGDPNRFEKAADVLLKPKANARRISNPYLNSDP